MIRLRAAFFGAFPALFIVGCAGILGIPSEVDRESANTEDASRDADATVTVDGSDVPDADAATEAEAGPPACNVSKDFDPPVPVDGVNTAEDEGAARLTDDELTMYVDGSHAVDGPSYGIYFTTRATVDSPFGQRTPFPSTDTINTSDDEYAPNVTADDKTLVFERKTLATSDSNFYIATRSNPGDPFGAVSTIANLNTPAYESNVYLRDTATELWHVRKPIAANANTDISVATLTMGVGYVIDPPDGQLEKVNLATSIEASPVISKNGLALYFASDRPGGPLGRNIWVATRSARGGKFNVPVIVANVNSDGRDYPGFISSDGCRLYLASDRAGGMGAADIYVAKKPK